mgnify:CR=1 FL=1
MVLNIDEGEAARPAQGELVERESERNWKGGEREHIPGELKPFVRMIKPWFCDIPSWTVFSTPPQS